jgi:ribosomal protein S18 acetylase RimI-like enzyme
MRVAHLAAGGQVSEIIYTEVEGLLDSETLHALGEVAGALVDELHGQGTSSRAEPDAYAQSFHIGLVGRKWIYACLAYDGDKLVGYKVGRSSDPREFESWRGGVMPTHRRRGIARELAKRQESWCRAQRFQAIFTQTDPDNLAMIALSLSQGFMIGGSFLKRGVKPMTYLVKVLTPDP